MSWIDSSLGECCELYQPQTITTKELKHDGKYLVYGANGVIGRYDKYNHEEPQLLITCRGATCGAVNVSSEYAWINGNAMVVKPKVKELDVKFLEYFFRGAVDLTKAITGAAQPQITRQSLSPIKFSYPPLATQQKIVGRLDAIFAEITKATLSAEANTKNAEALFQSYLQDVFERGGDGWIEKSIEDITIKTKNVSPEKSPNLEFKYVDVSSVSNSDFFITNTQSLLGKDAPSRAKKNIVTHDIIFATVRPTLKRVAIVPKELNNQIASTGYVVLRTKPEVHFKFIFFYLLSNTFINAMEKLQRGASYPAVTDGDVKSQRLKVPSYKEQLKISEDFETMMLSVASIKKSQLSKLNELSNLRNSILKKAFSGELVKE